MVSGMQQLRMNTAGLSTLPESPSQLGTGEGGPMTGSTLQHRGSIKRSPLGRSVVTALEAELNQVRTLPIAAQTASAPSHPACENMPVRDSRSRIQVCQRQCIMRGSAHAV